jgi:UDP-N-acetylmuramoyl-tripeptide--D-alanyl-D-alanine ligase
MISMTVKELLEATGGRLLGGSQDVSKEFTGVKTDNRECGPGDLFIAIVGEKNDAHRFIPGALEKGAAGCLVSRELESYEEDRFYVLVRDTTLALGDLARYYRGKFDIPVIGVTGSVGKTTTKDMIAAVLSARFRVLKTEGNLNNNFGVPRMLLQLEREHEIAVIEMGMNHLGEIDYLTKIAGPDAAVITNIGDAHIGNLGSKENILKAKSEIFAGLSPKGIAVLNGDDALLRTLEGKIPFPIRWAGQGEDCDFRAVDIDDSDPGKLLLTAQTPRGSFRLEVPQPGRHMLYSVMTAAALGQYFGMTNEEIANIRGLGKRGYDEILEKLGRTARP